MHKNLKNIIGKIGKLYKTRDIKVGTRGFYFQDTELTDTLMQPEHRVNCKLIKDEKSNRCKLVVHLSMAGSVKVCKRDRTTHLNPVIDVRRKPVQKEFSRYKYVEVQIYGEKIVVRGFNNISESRQLKKLIEDRKKSKNGFRLIDLFKRLELKKEIELSKEYVQNVLLAKASGDNSFGYEQVTFDYLLNNIESSWSSSSCSDFNISSVRENLDIAMNMVSFCSGAGVLDKGFIDQGFTGVLAMDIEKDMVETYKANLGDHAVVADLSAYDLSNLPVDKEPKLLVAGTPCQDLSNANRVTGKILDSEKNLLIRKTIDCIKAMPSLDVFIFENVPQLLTKGKKFVEEIKDRLSDFEITVSKVNAFDFGSAQVRERAIIIGSKIGKIDLKAPVLRICKTVRQAFAGLTDETPNQLDFTKSGPDVQKRMSYVRPGGNFKDIPEELRGKGTHSNSYKRLEWDKPSITIANPRKSCIMPPEGNRILSIRECARLFDLPDSFKFVGKLANMQQMIANAVPYALSSAIAKQVKQAFIDFYGDRCLFGSNVTSC